MDFQPDAGLAAFRQEVRDFLAQVPAELKGLQRCTRSPREQIMRWQKLLQARGWGAPYWAKEHGGTGWSVPQILVFDDECSAAGTPTQDAFVHKMLGPVLNAFATPEQKAEHLPAIFNGERLWCQGFSEPGAGSDLAALRTRAERDGDHYVINGQKIWTSYAHHADWIFLLVRTDFEVKKQAGISFLLVDMNTPGVTVRPIRSIDDAHHLNETFFDNVRVPVGNLIGAEGQGWNITKFLLNNEHATTADLPELKRYMRELRLFATAIPAGEGRLIERTEFALKLARLDAELQAIGMLVQRVAQMEQRHDPASHVLGSMLKIRATELQQRITEVQLEALGDYGAVAYAHPHEAAPAQAYPLQELARGIANDMFLRRASTIYGGTSEVQRGIIAKMLFQL
ncbi:acyl-CoA dehydrogenase family protein [Pseudomonas sp. PDM18]|uniref:Acyl-CoA dehydrogenase n=1 Tax=Pseudomonas nitroreducens TaxID=46680 RepID=A0A5R9AGD3_PSENT|nr:MULTISPECIES: acyl-CoA dehydrogenase family protein [Pseudomonas]MBD9634644.1 acyl-CoA dehydrogenase family protein [Pseudomonas sp. PDM19]MBD9679458.1 acyl-CoA dehydrogenase family protein [Pseudomonas sp. PDM18]TLP77638.1 acyl-CoA dehydrogenase [Pseudomonas nitroreducens]